MAHRSSVRAYEAPARETLGVRYLGEKRIGLGRLERQEREPFPAIDPSDGTRREAAEPSGRVVQKYRPTERAHLRSPT